MRHAQFSPQRDGGEWGIERFYSVENHENSDGPDADGIEWAADRLWETLR